MAPHRQRKDGITEVLAGSVERKEGEHKIRGRTEADGRMGRRTKKNVTKSIICIHE
jgi:hypothetical protein